MMTRGLAREWARSEINVNAICPGYIETEINDFWWQTDGGKQIASWPRRRWPVKKIWMALYCCWLDRMAAA